MKIAILLLALLLIFGCSKKQDPTEPEPETFRIIVLRSDSHPEAPLWINYSESYQGEYEGELIDWINPSDSVELNGQLLWGKSISGSHGGYDYDFPQNESTYIFSEPGWQSSYSPKDTIVNTIGLDTLIWRKSWWFTK